MKKLLLSFVLILAVTVTASAQRHVVKHTYKTKHTYTNPAPRPRPIPSYAYTGVGELRLHIGGELGLFDIGGIFFHELPRHYSIGGMAEYQAGRMLSLGVGADFYGSRGTNRIHFNSGEYLNCVPIYGMVRLSTPRHNTKLFVEARAGYAIPINQVYAVTLGNTVMAQGFYTGAGMGLSFYGSNISVGFNSIDVHNVSRKAMLTDFYLRYSYAIPLN